MGLKDKYYVKQISRETSKVLLDEYHYLHKTGDFRSGINFGLFTTDNILVGVIVFTTVSAKYVAKGCFGINTYKIDGFYELGRLCMNPHYHEKNLTSFFLGNSIKILRKLKNITALLTYADSDYHLGYVYQACSFKYYGLTSPKKDFFYIDEKTGKEVKLQRGKCRHLKGEWRDKSRKHRYLLIYDKNLKTIWKEEPYPKGEQKAPFNFNDTTSSLNLKFIPKEVNQLELFNN